MRRPITVLETAAELDHPVYPERAVQAGSGTDVGCDPVTLRAGALTRQCRREIQASEMRPYSSPQRTRCEAVPQIVQVRFVDTVL